MLVTVHVLVSLSFMLPTQSGEKLDCVLMSMLFIVIGLISVSPLRPAGNPWLDGREIPDRQMRGKRRNI